MLCKLLGCLLMLLSTLSTPAFATITGNNNFGAGNSNCDADIISSQNVTGATGNLIAVCVTTEVATGTAVLPTVVGNSGVIFTQIQTVTSPTPTLRTTLFTGISNGTPAPITVGISEDQSNCTYSVANFSGIDTTTPIRQSGANASDVAQTGLSTPFPAGFSDVENNAVYGCFGHNTNGTLTIAAPVVAFAGSSGCCATRTIHGWKVGQESSVIVNGPEGLHLGIVAELNFGTAETGTRRRLAPIHETRRAPKRPFFAGLMFLFPPLRGGYVAG